jgi:RNA polymerase sigma-70 factor, ECF subfamily
MQDRSDADLLAAVAGGEEPALKELVNRHSGWLLLRLQRRTPDPELAQDALSDTFVAAWRTARKYRGEGDVGAWLWGIAIRRLTDRLRKRAAPRPVPDEVLASLSPVVADAEDQLLVAVEHSTVADALQTLSPELVRVLQATVIDGLSTREAAQLLGIPQGTVKSRLRVAKVKLREQLISMEGWT